MFRWAAEITFSSMNSLLLVDEACVSPAVGILPAAMVITKQSSIPGIMTVYQDFFHYREGIYRHTRHGDQLMRGLHSVRIVGWGEDAEDKYWVSLFIYSRPK